MRIKICGITRREELALLAALDVDFAGLWHGVPGGRAELMAPAVSRLAAAARSLGGPEPVLVTLLSDLRALRRVCRRANVSWIQLHGYQTPGLVAALKRDAGTRVIKALHVREGRCVEAPLISAYERAGTDVFLIDAVTADGRIGSTGQPLDAGTVAGLARRLARPFLLAGGISAELHRTHGATARQSECLGIDVDTNARASDGSLCAERISAISRTWRDARVEHIHD